MRAPVSRANPRHLARRQSLRRRQYAAAQVHRLTGEWLPVGTDINTIITSSSTLVRNRVRQLVRDFPPFFRAANNLVAAVVGRGIRLQAKPLRPDGSLDRALARIIEARWQAWQHQADVAGRLHFAELQQLATRQRCENGEWLFVTRPPKRPGRHPFALQAFDAEALTDLGARPQAGAEIQQGVEFDAETGEALAYHFAPPTGLLGNVGSAVRVDAGAVIHGYQVLRPGQLRGISPFAAAVLLARDLGEYLGAEVDAAKLASKWLAFVSTADPAGWQAMRTTTDSQTGQRIETLENAIIEYLRPGESINFQSHSRPNGAFEAFSRFLLRLVAVVVDVPYEVLSGDYQDTNYTTLRASRMDWRQQLAVHHLLMELGFCAPTYRRWLDAEVLHGLIRIPGYWQRRELVQNASWIPPGMPALDPLKESKANRDDITSGLKSPQEIMLARGADPEQVLDDLQEWQRMCQERGLAFETTSTTSTALASNPATILAEGEGGQKSLKIIK